MIIVGMNIMKKIVVIVFIVDWFCYPIYLSLFQGYIAILSSKIAQIAKMPKKLTYMTSGVLFSHCHLMLRPESCGGVSKVLWIKYDSGEYSYW